MASTTLDLPQPLGPTMQVVPEPLKVTTVRSQNDLKPTTSTLRSLSKMSSFCRQSLRGSAWRQPLCVFPNCISPFQGLEGFDPAHEYRLHEQGRGQNARRETTLCSSRGGSFERQVDRFSVA